MKDIDDERLCMNCERDKKALTELQFRRLEAWNAAARLMSEREWPEDGKPCPSDYLHLALFLTGED